MYVFPPHAAPSSSYFYFHFFPALLRHLGLGGTRRFARARDYISAAALRRAESHAQAQTVLLRLEPEKTTDQNNKKKHPVSNFRRIVL